MSATIIATAERVRDLTESVTLVITAKAKALRAQGHDVIGFGAGEPDFPTPAHIVAAAQRACADPELHRYSPTAGLAVLREAIAAKTRRDSGFEVAADQVLVANGGKQALFNAFSALIDPGDEVLLPSPYWLTYPEQIRLCGGRVVVVPTDADSGYRTGVEHLERARTPRTKALVFVSPSNPTGAVYDPSEVEAIGRWAVEAGVWVITDEIYEHLVYGGARHVSMPVVVPELASHCVVANGVAKTYAMTGWRVGWTIAPVALTRAMTRLQSHVTAHASNIAMAAATAAVEGPLDGVATMRATYDRRRRLAATRLDAVDGFTCPLPRGAFYAFPDVAGALGRPVGGSMAESSLDLCEVLLDVAQVALVPGEAFGAPGHVRLSYALSDDDLARGLDRIAEALGAPGP